VWGVAQIDKGGPFAEAEAQTLAAMQSGASVIVQGALSHDGCGGRPDILRRVEAPEVVGTHPPVLALAVPSR
jgi:hypothetical protein